MSHNDTSDDHDGGFPTTAWSLIDQAKDRSGSSDAVNRLIRRYWKPVYGFLRARRYPHAKAEDLTQEFFLRFLERDWLRRVDPKRGRFRTFMLTLLVRFLSDQSEHRIRRQERFEAGIFSISAQVADQWGGIEPADHLSPETVFLQQWATALLDHAREDVRGQCEQQGHARWYGWFEENVLAEAGSRRTKSELVRRDGVSRDQVRYGVEQVVHRLEQTIRRELAGEGCAEESLDEEVRDLMKMLAR
jgi:DNA-directed RNA polymerase specialized sigma24 family protein